MGRRLEPDGRDPRRCILVHGRPRSGDFGESERKYLGRGGQGEGPSGRDEPLDILPQRCADSFEEGFLFAEQELGREIARRFLEGSMLGFPAVAVEVIIGTKQAGFDQPGERQGRHIGPIGDQDDSLVDAITIVAAHQHRDRKALRCVSGCSPALPAMVNSTSRDETRPLS